VGQIIILIQDLNYSYENTAPCGALCRFARHDRRAAFLHGLIQECQPSNVSASPQTCPASFIVLEKPWP
jgi:hypothetical protein